MIWKFYSSKRPNFKPKPWRTKTLRESDVETRKSCEKSRWREMQWRKWVQEKVLTEVFKWGHARFYVFLKHVFGMQPVEREVTSKYCIIGGGNDFDAARKEVMQGTFLMLIIRLGKHNCNLNLWVCKIHMKQRFTRIQMFHGTSSQRFILLADLDCKIKPTRLPGESLEGIHQWHIHSRSFPVHLGHFSPRKKHVFSV